MSTLRRIHPLLTAMTLSGLLALIAGLVRAQPIPATSVPPQPIPFATVTLPSDARLRQKLEAAHDYIKAKEWPEAVRVLQDLIDVKEDQFLPAKTPPAEGKPSIHSGGFRGEALRLLAGLPPKGWETYNSVYGPKARSLLKEAIDRDDVALLRQVVQRYLHTEAGAEAAERLGSYYLDRGNRTLAARCFVHLLGRPGEGRLTPLALYKAAVACRLAGDKAHEEQAWKALATRAPDGLTIDGQARDLNGLRAGLTRLPAEPPVRGDWPLFRADAGRTSRGDGDVPLLEPLWIVNTPFSARKSELVDDVHKALERSDHLVMPGHYPLALPGRIVYRGHDRIHAVDPVSGSELWSLTAPTLPATSPLSLDAIVHSGMSANVKDWLRNPGYYAGAAAHFPLENSALGRLSTDGERVYAIEDLAVPPPDQLLLGIQGGMPAVGPAELVRALYANRLRALNLDTGSRVWEIGGRGPGDLQDCFFLGAPLPLDGKLYVLVEKEGEFRLVCLDPASGAVAWVQRLGVTSARLLLDPGRRLRGVQMTCAEGLLICPTDAGAVFAFDPFTRSLVWAHLHPTNKRQNDAGTFFNLAGFNVSWRESAPVIADGKVVFTPGDSDQVYCINLRDGKPLWQAAQNGSSYLAGVFRDKVLLVGSMGVSALSLKDGRESWTRNFGVPSGQGAASGNVYYLPLRVARETAGPGVAGIDVDSGKLLAFAQSRGGEVPGNLSFAGGVVLSQTATALTAYPQLKTRLKRVEDLLAGDPHNPRGLMERGTLRLDRGDLPGSLLDLRAAAEGSADEVKYEARVRLHDALRQALQHDFAAGEKYLTEFEASCRVTIPDGTQAERRTLLEAERQRREANYLLVLARGREGQGRLAEALAAYARLFPRADRVPGAWQGPEVGWMPLGKPAGRAAVSKPAPWINSRVTALVTGATGTQKAAVEKEVARQWQALPAGADLEEVSRFVLLFGPAGPVGLEARLVYAERLAEQPGRGRFLEAELHLLALQRQREAPAVAARALELLARLLTEKGQLDDALHYYRQLGEEFGPVAVRDGKTGADLLKALALDRRFLPLLDDPWAGQKFKTTEVRGLFPPRGRMIWMEPEGETPACLRRQRLAFDVAGGSLKLFDRNGGAELWSHAVGVGNLRAVLQNAPPQFWIPFRADGHLAVVSLGHFVYGIDLLERRLLWTKDLGDKPTPLVAQVHADDYRTRLKVQYQDGIIQSLGRMAPIQSAGVCLTVRDKWVGLDPLRGDTLWTAPCDDPGAELSSDENYVYLITGGWVDLAPKRRALSLADGVVRHLSAFPTRSGSALQVVGRNLLLAPATPELKRIDLVLYDPLAGKEVWSQPLAAGTMIARSEVPHLTATVTREGKVHVYDLRRRTELFHGEVDADHLRRVYEVRLFQDRMHYYLMLNRETRGRDDVTGPALPNAVGGLRCLPANGFLYAFQRDSGALHWASEVKTQHLILERFEESPLILFSAVVQRAKTPGPVFTVASIDKHTGKALWPAKDYAPITSPVHMVQINPATGTIDLITRQWKMRHSIAE
jgi:outer membrane protein assembly factor BamB/tetratricopeptide (TPR) repeat protein